MLGILPKNHVFIRRKISLRSEILLHALQTLREHLRSHVGIVGAQVPNAIFAIIYCYLCLMVQRYVRFCIDGLTNLSKNLPILRNVEKMLYPPQQSLIYQVFHRMTAPHVVVYMSETDGGIECFACEITFIYQQTYTG